MSRVLVTGGQGDLAQAIAHSFRSTGAEVLDPGRKDLDVTSATSIERFFSNCEPLDLLIANAGATDDRLLSRTSESDWDEQFEVNLNGSFRCARAAVRSMLRRRAGHLVFISSYSALHPPAGQAAYAAAKAALIGMAKSLARELGPANIRVNVILPGFLETRMTDKVTPERRAAVRADHCLGRFNTTAQVAAFLLHLDQQLPDTSGQVFQLDSRIG